MDQSSGGAEKRKSAPPATATQSAAPAKKVKQNSYPVPEASNVIVDDNATCIDITAADLVGRLSHTNVADIVLLSMVMLPDTMPLSFQSTYTPIAGAGSTAQVRHLARLLATQMTSACMGKGFEQLKDQLIADDVEKRRLNESKKVEAKPIASVVGIGRPVSTNSAHQASPRALNANQLPKKPRMLKLSEMIQQLNYDEMNAMTSSAFKRILQAQDIARKFGRLGVHRRIATSLATMSGKSFRDIYEDYIFADFESRGHLALDWLYQEYALMSGFLSSHEQSEAERMRKPRDSSMYEDSVSRILESLQEKPRQQSSDTLSSFLLVTPCLTESAFAMIKRCCTEDANADIIRNVILYREPIRAQSLPHLLSLTHSDDPAARDAAIAAAKDLCAVPSLVDPIETYALEIACYLKMATPPSQLSHMSGGLRVNEWSDDRVRMTLSLLLSLMTRNHNLIHKLTCIYTAATGDVKRSILKLIESPIKSMGIKSSQLLELVQLCPKGAETMITRVVHILTDKSLPSQELVEKIRDLYEKRIPDVRFLIPVLGGLRKDEIIPVLPKLITLTSAVVKEVFNRLLCLEKSKMPVNPSELLVELHKIPSSQCDIKCVIAATSYCFNERKVFDQSVLEEAISEIAAIDPLPVLTMRTILQSLALYPKIATFAVKILDGLITREVWKNQVIWQGFVKCCQKTRPHCFPMLVNLPSAQILQVLNELPDLKIGLSRFITTLSHRRRLALDSELLKSLNIPIAEIAPSAM